MRHTAVRADSLTVRRGGRPVVDDLTFTVDAGKITGLLGPSGSGKSTLMRAIVGVQIVQSGSLLVLGLPAGTAKLRTRVAYVTQSPSVYEDLSVRSNVRYFARVLGAGNADVDRVIDAVDLRDFAGHRVGQLSGGQRSRVSLSVALLGKPELLVLDEPTVGLDPLLRRDLWNLFHRLASQGQTLLVSSHVMDEAARCDNLLLMRDGCLLADGTLTSVLASTGTTDVESAFVALVGQQS